MLVCGGEQREREVGKGGLLAVEAKRGGSDGGGGVGCGGLVGCGGGMIGS